MPSEATDDMLLTLDKETHMNLDLTVSLQSCGYIHMGDKLSHLYVDKATCLFKSFHEHHRLWNCTEGWTLVFLKIFLPLVMMMASSFAMLAKCLDSITEPTTFPLTGHMFASYVSKPRLHESILILIKRHCIFGFKNKIGKNKIVPVCMALKCQYRLR